MNFKPLVKCLGRNINDIQQSLTNHKIAYGHYTVRELRKAIRDRQPAIIPFRASTFLVMGENPESFILTDARGRVHEVADSDLVRDWNGRAVLIQGEAREVAVDSELVILTPERDNWPEEWRDAQNKAWKILRSLSSGDAWLPDHPVILVFRKPSDHEIKNYIRSMTVGPEIVLYDPSDPVSEFFHELGHIYWSNRLTDQERNDIRDQHATLSADTVSPLFTTKAHWDTDQEYFATIYMWYAKGNILHDGYMKLLRQMDPAGYRMITSIIDRVGDDAARRRSWDEAEPLLRAFVDVQQDSRRYMLIGKGRLFKARMSVALHGEDVVFPADLVAHEVKKRIGKIRFVRIGEGSLKGEVLPVEEGFINIPLTKAIYKYYQPLSKAIPGKKDISQLQGRIIIDGQGKKRIIYVRATHKQDAGNPTSSGEKFVLKPLILREIEPIPVTMENTRIRPEYITNGNGYQQKGYRVQASQEDHYATAVQPETAVRLFSTTYGGKHPGRRFQHACSKNTGFRKAIRSHYATANGNMLASRGAHGPPLRV